ncbi:MAG: DUF488 domain-containing protein [Microthrixaceae bacterium]
MSASPSVRVRRIYDDPGSDDGTRVLVDRIWPRGISKENAHLDDWCKEVAPSTELRKWYDHDPEKFEEFRSRYSKELEGEEPAAALAHLRELSASGTLTLLTASKAADISQASVLAQILSA